MLIQRLLGDYRNPWCQVCYDPVSLGTLAFGALASAGAGYGVQKLTQSKSSAPVVPTLQPQIGAPDASNPQSLQDTQNDLSLLGANGRDSTNLTKKRKGSSFLDEGGDASPAPAYTNTTLGG